MLSLFELGKNKIIKIIKKNAHTRKILWSLFANKKGNRVLLGQNSLWKSVQTECCGFTVKVWQKLRTLEQLPSLVWALFVLSLQKK